MNKERHTNITMSDSDSDNEDFAELFDRSLKACIDQEGRLCAKVKNPEGGFKLVPVRNVAKSIEDAKRRLIAEDPIGDKIVRMKTRSQTMKRNESQNNIVVIAKNTGKTKTLKRVERDN